MISTLVFLNGTFWDGRFWIGLGMVGKEGREENGRDGQAGSARDLPRNGRAIGICIEGMVSLRALSVLWSWAFILV
jgi:hypothetical protein